MSLISKLAIPIISVSLLLGGCSRGQSEEERGNLSSSLEQTKGIRQDSSLKNAWWKKEAPRRDNYVENFAGMDINMVWIPGGGVEYSLYNLSREDIMNNLGKDPDLWQREEVSGFWMSNEISVKSWLAFLNSTRYNPSRDTASEKSGVPSREGIINSGLRITDISLINIDTFLKYLSSNTRRGYDLPNVAEYFLATRGSKIPSEGVFGEISRERHYLKGLDNKPSSQFFPVDSLKTNLFGLNHLVGNAGEFVHLPSFLVKKLVDHKSEGYRNHALGNMVFLVAPSFESKMEDFNFCPIKEWRSKLDSGRVMEFWDSRKYSAYHYADRITDETIGFRIVRRPAEDLE